MCGRYSIFVEKDIEEWNTILHEVSQKPRHSGKNLVKLEEIYPSDIVPVLTGNGGGVEYQAVRWGFPGFRRKSVIINARAETAMEKPLFTDSLRYRRCAVPSTGFYEWSRSGPKVKYLFQEPGHPMLYMAGFYDTFEDEERLVILTTNANASMAEIHSRMPVILSREEIYQWIFDPDYAKKVLQRTPQPLVREMA
jgi:putative SOS response-associated peptidase YedK